MVDKKKLVFVFCRNVLSSLLSFGAKITYQKIRKNENVRKKHEDIFLQYLKKTVLPTRCFVHLSPQARKVLKQI
jgi:hypothetical protein